MYATLTPVQDHPLTGSPCLFVHPCRTADALDAVWPRGLHTQYDRRSTQSNNGDHDGDVDDHRMEHHDTREHDEEQRHGSDVGAVSNANYLLLWLGIVGPAVGLALPLHAMQRVDRYSGHDASDGD